MNKKLVGFLCAAAVMSAAVPGVSAEAPKLLVSANPAVVAPAVQYTLKIDDRTIDLGHLKIIKIKNRIMVPLRITSEALGFTVTWDGEHRTVHMDNGRMKTDLVIDEDNYFASSSKAIGMTAPESLGVAPVLIAGYTYLPVDFYKIILTDPNCVSIKDNDINISSSPAKPDKTQPSAGLPNPMVKYGTPDEARKAVGFDFTVPAALPDGYQMKDIYVIGGNLAEIFYLNGDDRVLYRTAMGNDDISGDYTVYDKVKTVTVGNTDVTVKGSGDSISLATWTRDGVCFSLSFDKAVNEQTLSTVIESIK